MKKNIFAIAAAALVLCLASCQKEELVNNAATSNGTPGNGETTSNARVKTTSDLNNTDWSYTVTYSEFVYNMTGMDLSIVPDFQDDTMTFGLNFDGTYAHFTFPTDVEAWGGDENGLQQISVMSYTYSYDGTTHTGYLEGVAEDANGNDVPAQLQFTYDDATDEITFVLNLTNTDDDSPVTLTLVFARNE